MCLDVRSERLEIQMLHRRERCNVTRVLRAGLQIGFDLFRCLARYLELSLSELRENLFLHFLVEVEGLERAGHQCSDNENEDEGVPSHECAGTP